MTMKNTHLFNYGLAMDVMAYIIKKYEALNAENIDFQRLMRLLVKLELTSLLSGQGSLTYDTFLYIPEIGISPINANYVASNIVRVAKSPWRFKNKDFPKSISVIYVGKEDSQYSELNPVLRDGIDRMMLETNSFMNWKLLKETNDHFNENKVITAITQEELIRLYAPEFVKEDLVDSYREQKISRETSLFSKADFYL